MDLQLLVHHEIQAVPLKAVAKRGKDSIFILIGREQDMDQGMYIMQNLIRLRLNRLLDFCLTFGVCWFRARRGG